MRRRVLPWLPDIVAYKLRQEKTQLDGGLKVIAGQEKVHSSTYLNRVRD